jgi:hypothetical protein
MQQGPDQSGFSGTQLAVKVNAHTRGNQLCEPFAEPHGGCFIGQLQL